MRTHGVTDFPYPTAQGGVSPEMVQAAGINMQSPTVMRAVSECLPPWLRPPKGLPNMLADREVLSVCTSSLRAAGCVRCAGHGGVAEEAGVTARPTVTANPAKQYQSIAGCGVSEGSGRRGRG